MIEVKNLSKSYGSFRAVDDISFTCRPGAVTGFLGPNGAGKSTAMRMIVGLTPPSSGQATIGGLHFAHIPNPGRHIGVLLDASAQHAGRTGREILSLGATTMGLPKSRVGEMLELVGLSPREAKRRVRHYSLGMRQRLGIAHALLADPKVLVLDEPVNGLDPAGIHWMRGLLRHHAERGGTVFLSSHLLHEIEVIADDLIVIGNGKIVAQGTKADLLKGQGTLVRTRQLDSLRALLRDKSLEFSHSGADGLIVQASPEDVGLIAAAAGVPLMELRESDGNNLEELFLTMTADSQRGSTSALPDGVVA